MGRRDFLTHTMMLPQGQERWVVVRTEQGEARAQATLKRQVEKAEHSCSKGCGTSPISALPVKPMQKQRSSEN